MSKKWITAIALYLGLLAVCIIALYAVPSVRGMLERTYIAEHGTMDVTDDVSAYIVRDETVYAATRKSSVNRLSDANTLVKAYTAVVELTPKEGEDNSEVSGTYENIMLELGDAVKTTEEGYTKDPGYVSYYVDGVEGKLTVENMDELTQKQFKELTDRSAKETPKRNCNAGDPVFKIVRNSKWYLVFYTDSERAKEYTPGSYVYMNVNDEQIRVMVHSVQDATEKYSRVTLECKSFFDGFLEERKLKTTVTIASAEGLLLRTSSIVEHDGGIGVFVKNKLGQHVYKPVALMAVDGDRCVAYADVYLDEEGNFVETIRTYDEIITEPSEEDIASLDKKDMNKTDGENSEVANGDQ